MNKRKDTVGILMPGLTNKELEIIEQVGYCEVTKKLLQLYCVECKTLITVEGFISKHKGHEVLENDKRNAELIFEELKFIVREKQKCRLLDLNGKAGKLNFNLKNLEMKRSASKILGKIQCEVDEVMKKMENYNDEKIGKWIDKVFNESLEAMKKLNNRISQASEDFDEFIENIEVSENLNPLVINCLINHFSSVLDKKLENDKKFNIHDVPNSFEYTKRMYEQLFFELNSCLVNNYIQTLAVLDIKNSENFLEQGFFEALGKVFEGKSPYLNIKSQKDKYKTNFIKVDQYEGENFKNSFEISEFRVKDLDQFEAEEKSKGEKFKANSVGNSIIKEASESQEKSSSEGSAKHAKGKVEDKNKFDTPNAPLLNQHVQGTNQASPFLNKPEEFKPDPNTANETKPPNPFLPKITTELNANTGEFVPNSKANTNEEHKGSPNPNYKGKNPHYNKKNK